MQKTLCLSCVYLSIYLNFEIIVTKYKIESKKHHIKNVNVALKEKQTKKKIHNTTQHINKEYTKDKLP